MTKAIVSLARRLVIVDETGAPVVRAAPIPTQAVFDRVGKELAGRENKKVPTKRSSALPTQVIFCGACGRPAYRLKGGTGRQPQYRCASAQYKTPQMGWIGPVCDAVRSRLAQSAREYANGSIGCSRPSRATPKDEPSADLWIVPLPDDRPSAATVPL